MASKPDEAKPEESTPITFNYYRYATKKTMAQGLLDVALLMSNASQLKAILDVGEAHDYYHALVAIVIISISLQVITGILLLILGSLKDHTERHVRRANILNNIIIGFILFITVANIFITAFGVQFSQKNKSPNPLFDPNNNNF
ncbi:ninjurin-1 isoform X2 [Octopus bimaculoides]|uniref:ninjurin-1 isoform X2 n=1 Tax=Octopus bimaculoides TaxID=37653 RepID=UPI00071DF873|nr:ninjurin-1 isoform X2 [Octopus bimaculoides]|eukprot:XP_014773313.1 PREDICTED: ninjurin-2-like isoform X1 [Octopus bimaculoides]